MPCYNGGMKSMVVYGSNFGNTQKVAEAIAAELGAQAVRVENIDEEALSDVDLLIVGTPINGWQPTEAIREFLAAFRPGQLKGVKATSFDTRVKLFIHGDAMKKVAKALREVGAQIVCEPRAFYVAGSQQEPHLLDGELNRARLWALEIKAAGD